MIGGSGNRLANIARTKSSPDIDAIKSMGTTPYSIVCSPDLSFMICQLHILSSYPDLIQAFDFFQKEDYPVKPCSIGYGQSASALVLFKAVLRSDSGLSRRIQQLEANLGVRLHNRTSGVSGADFRQDLFPRRAACARD
jgi:hypothetical protein